jgi:hypothetical protein
LVVSGEWVAAGVVLGCMERWLVVTREWRSGGSGLGWFLQFFLK